MPCRFLSTPSARRATREQPYQNTIGEFLSTPSARRATTWRPLISQGERFLSTPSARRATGGAKDSTDAVQISIHALREEGDHHGSHLCNPHCISIHALREEGDLRSFPLPNTHNISIHALREEGDTVSRIPVSPHTNFYPRPPRGGRPSIPSLQLSTSEFLSTPSARRATLSEHQQ